MRLLVLCTCCEVASNLPQGCVPQNYAILLFAYLLPLPYLVAVHSDLSLNGGIVTLTSLIKQCSKVASHGISHDSLVFVFVFLPWYIHMSPKRS